MCSSVYMKPDSLRMCVQITAVDCHDSTTPEMDIPV